MIKRIRIIAGPNGSGKSTLLRHLASGEGMGEPVPLYDVINPDDIKIELQKHHCVRLPFSVSNDELVESICANWFDNDVVSHFVSGEICCNGNIVRFKHSAIDTHTVAAFASFLHYAYLLRGRSFTLETVFSHKTKLQLLEYARKLGYLIYLYFVAVDSVELNKLRVKQRVAVGGHDVPVDKIERRYPKCLDNFYPALQYAYRAYFWDNSGDEMRLVAELKPDKSLQLLPVLPAWFQRSVLEKLVR